jgi:cytochrome c-type biogenesis protein CcmH/NrfG
MDIRTGISPELPSPTHYPTIDEKVARLTELQEALTLCPTDIVARQELAALLERLGQHEEALFNWKAVLACDPNSLNAREGVARCRQRSGLPLQSHM